MAADRSARGARALIAATTWLSLMGATGCLPRRAPGIHSSATISPVAIPAPIGTLTPKIPEGQTSKAEADDFVFSDREWSLDDAATLGPNGRRHLIEVANRLQQSACPAVIEPSPTDDRSLDNRRRTELVEALGEFGIKQPDSRVLVAYPQPEELTANKAPRIYPPRIRTQASGNSGPGGGGLDGGDFGGLGGGDPSSGGVGGEGLSFRPTH